MRALSWVTVPIMTLGACGGAGSGAAFDPAWQNDGGRSIAEVQARVARAPLKAGPGVAVGVTIEQRLVGVGLGGGGSWSAPVRPDSRPFVAGEVVVVTAGGQVLALDGATGKELWQVDSGGTSLRGAGDDGRVTVVSLGSAAGGGGLVLAVDRSGRVLQRLAPKHDVGTPAVQGGMMFLPWGSQYVSAVEVDSGNEAGRLLTRNQVSRAFAVGGTLFFGERELLRFDEAIGAATSGGAHRVALPARSLPGNPRWMAYGATVTPVRSSAEDRVRLYARPNPSGSPGLDSSRYAAIYYRIALGLDARDGKLRWARSFERDLIGGAAAAGGFAFCDAGGDVWLVAGENGGSAGKVSLGAPVVSCVVDAGDFQVRAAPRPEPLAAQVADAIRIKEADMGSIQRVLLVDLAQRDEPPITKLLVDLATDARTPPELMAETRRLLAARRTGPEHMLEALGRQYDFLEDVLRSPPVGPMADALAAMGERRAAPLLATHLHEPTNTTDDVRRAAEALVVLATAEETDALKMFFSLYRSTADDDNMVKAVLAAARALLQVGGDEATEFVRFAADDPLTLPAVKQHMPELLSAARKQKRNQSKQVEPAIPPVGQSARSAAPAH